MKCDKCGYDDKGTGDFAHVCGKDYSRTAVPTTSLRILEREVLVKNQVGSEVGVMMTVQVLQQRFETGNGAEWRDVPMVKEKP